VTQQRYIVRVSLGKRDDEEGRTATFRDGADSAITVVLLGRMPGRAEPYMRAFICAVGFWGSQAYG